MRSYTDIARDFAQALVDAHYDDAASMLAPALRRRYTPTEFARHVRAMYEGYAPDETPAAVHVDEEFSSTAWPTKLPGDIGYAYVGILGEDFVEAVTVIVSSVEGAILIRDIEWGRP